MLSIATAPLYLKSPLAASPVMAMVLKMFVTVSNTPTLFIM